jgi:hypothetical protein
MQALGIRHQAFEPVSPVPALMPNPWCLIYLLEGPFLV